MRIDRLLDAKLASPNGSEAIALLTETGHVISYAQLAEQVSAVAETLQQRGLQPGHRFMLLGENSADMVVVMLAAVRTGAWAVPLNPRMSAAEIDGISAHCKPRMVYFASQHCVEAGQHAARYRAQGDSGGTFQQGHLFDLPKESQPDGSETGTESDVAIMIYTSGTTGLPKGVMLTHANLDFVTRTSLAQQVILAGDRIFHAMPISHSYGLITILLCGLRAGACIHLVTRFSAEKLASAIMDGGITVFQGVPAMYARLFEWSVQTGRSLRPNQLRMLYIGGSQIDAQRKAQTETLLGIRLHHGYGLTESSPVATRTFGHQPPADVTAGWPVPGVEVVLRDAEGRIVVQGQGGEVCIRGPNVMKGYFRDPVQTAAALDAQGWLKTGDVGVFGPDGDLSIIGRIKEMIIRSGFNVYPAEIERVIAAWPGVAQCAVVGRSVAGDEEVIAFIEPIAGLLVDVMGLSAHLRLHLAPYKLPAHLLVMEKLPASGTGKVLKSVLKQQFSTPPE